MGHPITRSLGELESPPTLLEQSFIHLDGVGAATERKLWDRGIACWAEMLEKAPPKGFSSKRWDVWRPEVARSMDALATGDHRYFASQFPAREQWRCFDQYRDTCAYLDIETAGWGRNMYITMVGLYDGSATHTFIRGKNLDAAPEALSAYRMLVTFNGTGFDLPHLRAGFPGLVLDQVHIDLRTTLGALGYSGGLKSIEREFGLCRDDDIAGMTGFDAIKLWRRYKRGHARSLELLVRYNTADIENLEVLAVYAAEALREQLRSG